MAFGFTFDTEPFRSESNKIAVSGAFTNSGGSTGGTITTGLNQIHAVFMTPTGAAAAASAPTVDGTFPIQGSSFVIVTDANQNGIWKAIGR